MTGYTDIIREVVVNYCTPPPIFGLPHWKMNFFVVGEHLIGVTDKEKSGKIKEEVAVSFDSSASFDSLLGCKYMVMNTTRSRSWHDPLLKPVDRGIPVAC